MERAERDLFERSLRHAATNHTGAAFDAALVDLGWHELLELEPPTAVSTLFELQGAALVSSCGLDAVLAAPLQLPTASVLPFVLPRLGRWDPPGSIVGERLLVAGLISKNPDETGEVRVIAGSNGTAALTAVVVSSADLTLRPLHGMDPSLDLQEVTGELALPDVRSELGGPDWATVLARGRLALAHELVGASKTMLELARQHALDRTQFGQAIGKFQAVRHRLAETLVAVEAAAAMLEAAWEDGSPATAGMAKALAGRGARTAARHCQQVLAGIGFTTEHDFHRYLRRVLVLDALLGGSRSLTKDLGAELLASRELPKLVLL